MRFLSHVVLIVNPLATSVDEHRVALVERMLSQHARVATHLTQRRGHATELALELSAGADAIFVFSGDGGFNEVVNGLGLDAPPVGCIPGGGTSVFPRSLGIPRDPIEATEQLAEAFRLHRARTITLGRVNGRRFLFSAGLHVDAELIRRIEAQRSQDGRPGDAAFLMTLTGLIAEHRGRFDPVLEIDGLGRAAFMFVANGNPYTYIGRIPLHFVPTASLEGGLDVTALTRVRLHTIPRLLRYALTGRGHLRDRSILSGHDLDRIVVHCDRPLPLHVDGEDLGDVTEAVFEAERGAISVLV